LYRPVYPASIGNDFWDERRDRSTRTRWPAPCTRLSSR